MGKLVSAFLGHLEEETCFLSRNIEVDPIALLAKLFRFGQREHTEDREIVWKRTV